MRLKNRGRELRLTLRAICAQDETWLLNAFDAGFEYPAEALELLTAGNSWQQVAAWLREERTRLPSDCR